MSFTHFSPLLPARINTGPWVAGYTLDALKQRVATDRIVLPICSLGTPAEDLAGLAPLVLPPLYHEALDEELKTALVVQIRSCFPYFEGTRDRAHFRGVLEVVELPAKQPMRVAHGPTVLAFGVDTTVEQHGPHLPLGTDTIQTYAVLDRLAAETEGMQVGPPLDYGHLTWGLPFGMSIDLTPALSTRYMCGYVNALLDWLSPASLYVADVHGSIVHRNAIQEGLRRSRCSHWAFRWLHDPLVEFGFDRGDAHAGGVETKLIELINSELVDSGWWPRRVDELTTAQMTTADAIQLSSDLPRFIERVQSGAHNGIVGDIQNAFRVDARELMNRMLTVAREDVERLRAALKFES